MHPVAGLCWLLLVVARISIRLEQVLVAVEAAIELAVSILPVHQNLLVQLLLQVVPADQVEIDYHPGQAEMAAEEILTMEIPMVNHSVLTAIQPTRMAINRLVEHLKKRQPLKI
ncbi:hypothetical protein [Leptolyngbya sp. 7M]|uniref:hypothetical protein n=1 Tax=Leptolyngbya sp. 7M TaxID=2812896 RepID=UPI001B8D88AC|nr:hypothetical protein [Leptolyngbya sp. 7M]QYO65119.1 hypothetical protein JVX88_37415 [Leptolyngbya sp. 7M]